MDGPAAAEAVRAGLAHRLAGGPSAFVLARMGGRIVPAASLPEGAALDRLCLAPPAWAGLDPGRPAVMGILNVTPDSFSDGGDFLDHGRAVEAGQAMMEQGADMIDVGGETTRPGSQPTPPEEERARIIPVVHALAARGIPVSVDTRNAAIMQAALDAGARVINDVSALRHDPASLAVVAAHGCPVVLMHSRHQPENMTALAQYDDVAAEVADELAERVAVAEAAGIPRERIAIDPGIGFAKTAVHNLELLSRLGLLLNLGCRLLVGVSRKRFIGTLSGEAEPRRRQAGSIAAALHALRQGASVLRVHDVQATVQAVRVWRGLTEIA
jgi:dihydropteroate synthase